MNISIVGGGYIVNEVLPVLEAAPNINVRGIYTRRSDVGAALKEQYNIPCYCDSYEALLKLDDIDFVYIAITNDLHYEFAAKALEQGKNVILEKPFTHSAECTAKLCRMAKEKKLYLFEAISTLYNPMFIKAKNALSGLGKVKSAKFSFFQYSSRFDNFKKGIISPVFDYKKAGGVLMDLGVYCIHPAMAMFGKADAVEYSPVMMNKVDIEGTLILKYSDFDVTCQFSKARDGDSGVEIICENGSIISHDKPNIWNEMTIVKDGVAQTFENDKSNHRLIYQWLDFEKTYSENNYNKMLDMLDITCLTQETIGEVK